MFSLKDNCINTSQGLLKILGIKYTQSYLQDSILSHPDHPSLLCISDVLVKYGIESLAVKVNETKLSKLPLPCIVQVSNRGGLFRVLTDLSNDKAVYIGDRGKIVEELREKFLMQWTGVCLLIEASESSKEPGLELKLRLNQNMTILKWSITALLILSLVLSFVNSDIMTETRTLFLGSYTILKLIGVTVGAMLLWYEVDKYNPTLQSFCSGDKGVNCDAVLSSRYAKLFKGRLSLGLLCFSYFFGTLSYLAIGGFSSEYLHQPWPYSVS